MSAVAFHQKQVYSGQSAAALRLQLINPDLLLDSPMDLHVAAFSFSRNKTVYALIEQYLGTDAARQIYSRCNCNNPVTWFDALLKYGQPLKKDFTFETKQRTIPQQEKMMTEIIKKPRLDKLKRIKKLKQENPRRAGTAGWKSWEILKPGMDVAGFLEEGGRIVDLNWDLKKGNLELY